VSGLTSQSSRLQCAPVSQGKLTEEPRGQTDAVQIDEDERFLKNRDHTLAKRDGIHTVHTDCWSVHETVLRLKYETQSTASTLQKTKQKVHSSQ